MDCVDALFLARATMPSTSRYASTGPLPSPIKVGFVGFEAVQREAVLLGVDATVRSPVRWRRAECEWRISPRLGSVRASPSFFIVLAIDAARPGMAGRGGESGCQEQPASEKQLERFHFVIFSRLPS
jgi:hypothetical protein